MFRGPDAPGPRTHRPEVETPKEGNAMADPVPSKARRSALKSPLRRVNCTFVGV